MENWFCGSLPADNMNSADQLLYALLGLMREKSFSEISITELCQSAGLSRTTFYKFLSNKDGLLDHLKEDLELGFIAYRKTLDPSVMPSEQFAFYHYFSYWYQLREWVSVLVRDGLWERIAMPNEKTYSLVSDRDLDTLLAQEPDALEMMYHFIAAGCVQLVEWWSRHNFEKTPEEMAKLVAYTLSGIPSKLKENFS